MTFASQDSRAAWWKQLSDHIHERTGRQLRRLQIRMSGGRIVIGGRVPSEDVRRSAEEAALEIVPEEFLALRLSIDGQPDGALPADQASPSPPRRQPDSNPLLDLVRYRRLYNLVTGN